MYDDLYVIVHKITKKAVTNRVYLTEKNAIREIDRKRSGGHGKDYCLCKYSIVATRENGEWVEEQSRSTGIEGPFDLANPMDYVTLKDYYIEREGFISTNG